MPFTFIQRFLQLESAGGMVLFAMATLALVLSNSPWAHTYLDFFQSPINVQWGPLVSNQPLLFWINDGLMTLFFLLVGVELKREFIQGELAGWSQALFPAVAALGGMLIPAIIYISINYHHPEAFRGWAIPVATDIAFSLGVLSLLSHRVPLGLKTFLMTLAIVDDVGAIIIIAVFYSHGLSVIFLGLAAVLLILLACLNYFGVSRLWPYLLLGFLLWVCVLHSGIHATIAGVLLAMMIPLHGKERNTRLPAEYLEKQLHPWVVYFVMPLFALANAGVNFVELPHSFLFSNITLGIVLGLMLGKQLGIFGCVFLMIKFGWAQLPKNTTWLQIYGVAIIAGIGFTMSLFLGTLAFESSEPSYMIQVRLGVLLGSLLSGLVGAALLQIAFKKKLKNI